MEKECLLINFNRDLNDLVALDKRLQKYELRPIYESAIHLLPSITGDMSHANDGQDISMVALETLYILSRHGPTWSEFDGRALFEQLLDILLSNGPNLECGNVKIIILKILTNTGYHLGSKLEKVYLKYGEDFEEYLKLHFKSNNYFAQYLILRIIHQGGLQITKFRSWLGLNETMTSQIFSISEYLFDEYHCHTGPIQQSPQYLFNAFEESLKLIFCSFYNDISNMKLQERLATYLNKLVKYDFIEIDHEESVFNRIVANCERLDKKYLKLVLELPENNFENNFCKTKIVDRFINDLQDKLRKFKLKKTGDSKDALKIIMKVTNTIIQVSRHARLRLKSRLRLNDRDFTKVPECGDSFSAQMISLFTSADEQLKTRSAELFFIIAKQNADRFISITGYGNGAGLLYDAGILTARESNKKLDIEYSDTSDSEDDKREEIISDLINERKGKSEFNPVTCRVEPKAIDSRSFEQKEYDAVRLATLLTKASKLPIRPMTLDANGKMTSFEEIQMKAKLKESDSDSDN